MWIESFIQADWAFSFAMSIILSIIKGAVLFLVLFILEKSLFRHSAKAKYRLYILGLTFLALIFLRDIFIFGLSYGTANMLNIDPLENMISGLSSFVLTVPESNPQVFQLISIAWTIGILFYGIKFSINNRFLAQLRKSSVQLSEDWQQLVNKLQYNIGAKQSIKILGSNKIDVPIVMGIVQPIILIPFPLLGHFTPKELETIILHELIHIKRADFLIKHIQSIILCFMYFNPAAWMISKKIDSYREFSCDDEVISISKEPKQYLKALYEVAKYSLPQKQRSIALFNHKSELVMRINRIITPKQSKWRFRSMFPIVISLLAMSTLFAFQINEDFQEEIEVPITNILMQDVNLMPITTPITSVIEMPVLPSVKPRDIIDINAKFAPLLDIPAINSKVKLDTLPNKEKIKKLEKELEVKTREMEELSLKMEKVLETTIELDAQKLDKLAAELEAKIQPQIEKMELEMENSKAMLELEKLSKEFELQYENRIKEMELKIDNEKMKEIELRMESLGEELEREMEKEKGEQNEKKIQDLKDKIQHEAMNIQNEMKNFQELHLDLQNDAQFKDMQAKMQELSQELANQSQMHNQIWDEQSKRMQEEMQLLQENIQKNMKEIQPKFHEDLQQKAKEIEQIARELEKEKAKGKKKGKY